jgi:hypothetical protein
LFFRNLTRQKKGGAKAPPSLGRKRPAAELSSCCDATYKASPFSLQLRKREAGAVLPLWFRMFWVAETTSGFGPAWRGIL